MHHPKLVSLALMLAVFGCVGAIAWGVMSLHTHIESPIKNQMPDTTSSTNGNLSIPNVVAWQGGWKNKAITENYAFAFYSSIC
jgi:hypothetical protein